MQISIPFTFSCRDSYIFSAFPRPSPILSLRPLLAVYRHSIALCSLLFTPLSLPVFPLPPLSCFPLRLVYLLSFFLPSPVFRFSISLYSCLCRFFRFSFLSLFSLCLRPLLRVYSFLLTLIQYPPSFSCLSASFSSVLCVNVTFHACLFSSFSSFPLSSISSCPFYLCLFGLYTLIPSPFSSSPGTRLTTSLLLLLIFLHYLSPPPLFIRVMLNSFPRPSSKVYGYWTPRFSISFTPPSIFHSFSFLSFPSLHPCHV